MDATKLSCVLSHQKGTSINVIPVRNEINTKHLCYYLLLCKSFSSEGLFLCNAQDLQTSWLKENVVPHYIRMQERIQGQRHPIPFPPTNLRKLNPCVCIACEP